MHPIPYGKHNISNQDIKAVVDVLKSNFLTQGPEVPKFEAAFANYMGCKFAIAVANGTAALHLSAIALGVNQNANVITTPFTFVATANCIRFCNGNVYFADIDPFTHLLDISKVEALIQSKPAGFFSGIITVDYAGKATHMEAFNQLASKYGLWLLQDSCHAPGAYFMDAKGKPQLSGNCNYADLAIFSFHPVKHIACGEGGMICTNNEAYYKQIKRLRTHGIFRDFDDSILHDQPWYYEMQELGYNYRLTDMQAALGHSQLTRANQGLVERRAIALRYCNAFKNAAFLIAPCIYDDAHAYHLFVIQVSNRLGLYHHLKAHHILAQVHYIPLHTMPYYRSLGYKPGDFPIAEMVYQHCISIPIYPGLSSEEQDYIITCIQDFYNNNS